MEGITTETPVALVAGVTSLPGLSLAEALKDPTALGGPWKVHGAARRRLPRWFPPSTLDSYIAFDALDYDDTHHSLSPISHQVTHLFWDAVQFGSNEEESITLNTTMLKNVITSLTSSSPASSLRHVTLLTGTKHYMCNFFDPAFQHQSQAVSLELELPFREGTPRQPYPVCYYALEDLVASYSPKLTWAVHRSSIILGASSRSANNTLLTLVVYALICRHENSPFRFPGTRYTWEHFCDMTDAGLLARQQIWAAVSGGAKNQAFNCVNGDVFTWKSFWGVFAAIFGVEPMPPVGADGGDESDWDWVGEMEKKRGVWDAIVKENGLVESKMEEITCFGMLKSVLCFRFQHVSCMNKSREFGFLEYVDTLKSLAGWVKRLGEMNIVPKI